MANVDDEAFLQRHCKISVTCRICMQGNSSGVKECLELFSGTKHSEDIIGKIFMCTQVLIADHEHLPKRICRLCLEELELANTFRLKCLVSDDTLTKYSKLIEKKSDYALEEDCNDFPDTSDLEIDLSINIKEESNITYVSHLEQEKVKENYKCEVCNKVLKTSASLYSHKISMHKNKKLVGKVTGYGSSRLHHCLKCPYTTKRGQSLMYHMRTHTGEKPYECECGKQFAQPASLAAHLKTHSTETFHTCPNCGKQFKYLQSFKKHQRVHEGGTFVCGVCNKVLKSNETLKAHMQRHYNIKNYSCEQCGNTFVTASELINHRKKHAKLRTFECNMCNYNTHLKKLLIAHIKRHSGERSHQCDMCEYSFITPWDLARHRRRHTQEKPYFCPVCNQRFKHSSSVNKHVRNIHGSQYLWNDDVDRTSIKIVTHSENNIPVVS